jgi:predicted RNA-binding Zn-ribbon protein involved in translation (DUF1610 family)
MKQILKVDLTKIDGDGEFFCPNCNEIISPEDKSGLVYDIIDIQTGEGGTLNKVIIECKSCRNFISLIGFELLNTIGYSEDLFDMNEYMECTAEPIQ